MSAPLLWIFLPFLAGGALLLLPQRYAAAAGGTVSALLALLALGLPIDTPLLLGSLSFKIAAAVQILGRSFIFSAADGKLLAFIYGLAALWFFGARAYYGEKRFVSLGLMIVALLVASIAVEPFLYAALLLETAVILAIPMLVSPYQPAGRGVLRFLIYQTLAMPFILFSGWMLAGAEVASGDAASSLTFEIMLGLGFAFLFGVFPLYSWIPTLMEENPPYAAGFLLWAFSFFTTVFALGFLERYAWLRSSDALSDAMIFAGTLMVASAGTFAALQKHVGRMMGYAAVVESGLILLAFGLRPPQLVLIVFFLLLPRGLELALWALSLTILKREAYSLRLSQMRGLARKYPAATAALILAHFSVAGVPLLAGFPPRLLLWQELARRSLSLSFWTFLGMSGLLAAAIRSLAVFIMADEDAGWSLNESWLNFFMLFAGALALLLLGIFPQILQPFLDGLPALFEHLGR